MYKTYSYVFKTPRNINNIEFPGISITSKCDVKLEKVLISSIGEQNLETFEDTTEVLELPKLDAEQFCEDEIENCEESLPSPPSLNFNESPESRIKCVESSASNDESLNCQMCSLDSTKVTESNNKWEAIDESTEAIDLNLIRTSTVQSTSSLKSYYDECFNDSSKLSNKKDIGFMGCSEHLKMCLNVVRNSEN